MKNKLKLCSLEPDFPPIIYLVYFYFLKDDIRVYIAMNFTGESEKEIIETTKIIAKELKKEKNDFIDIMSDTILYFPLYFQRKILLKEEYWMDHNPEGVRTQESLRSKAFYLLTTNPQMYDVLVVPKRKDKKRKFILNPDFPFYKNVSDEELDKYLMKCRSVVDQKAKFAAIYSLGGPLNLNWKTGEVGIIPSWVEEQEKMS